MSIFISVNTQVQKKKTLRFFDVVFLYFQSNDRNLFAIINKLSFFKTQIWDLHQKAEKINQNKLVALTHLMQNPLIFFYPFYNDEVTVWAQ